VKSDLLLMPTKRDRPLRQSEGYMKGSQRPALAHESKHKSRKARKVLNRAAKERIFGHKGLEIEQIANARTWHCFEATMAG